METAAWVNAVADSVTAIVAIIAILIAWGQLTNLGNTLKLSGLNTVLEIEAQMNARKEKVDEISEQIQLRGADNPELLQNALNARLENWFNAVDRLAFVILQNYVPEKAWVVEYRDYINNIVKNHDDFFKPATRYRNILDLNNKWQRQ